MRLKPNLTMPKFNKKSTIIIFAILLLFLLIFVGFRGGERAITSFEFENLFSQNKITNATIKADKLLITADKKRYFIPKDVINLVELSKKIPINIEEEDSDNQTILALFLFLIMLIVGFEIYKRRSIKKNQNLEASAINLASGGEILPVRSSVGFGDVAGIDEVKVELLEIVEFLKKQSEYKKLGINVPKGVLLIGPPGVGKTLVAKAVAGEANVPFFYQSGASFVQIYVGMGAKRVRELFAKAKAYAPSIIFIDEIDAVGKARGGDRNDEREATLNQLLTEMDGFEDSSGVIVMAATNKIEMIDEALLRSGRFDRRIFVSLPDLKDRVAILNRHLKDKICKADINLVAKNTTGFSGAALATLVNEAAINAFRRGALGIENLDFDSVKNRVLFGKRRVLTLSEDEKVTQSLYQAAKAVSAEWFDIGFEKISLLEDRFIINEIYMESKSSLLLKIKLHLSGLAALEIYKNEAYTNSQNDINKARELANKVVLKYAMSGKFLASQNDVSNLLDECYKDTLEFISGVKDQIYAVGEYIFENESIDRASVKEILRKTYER